VRAYAGELAVEVSLDMEKLAGLRMDRGGWNV
jgi:hypothetical protein